MHLNYKKWLWLIVIAAALIFAADRTLAPLWWGLGMNPFREVYRILSPGTQAPNNPYFSVKKAKVFEHIPYSPRHFKQMMEADYQGNKIIYVDGYNRILIWDIATDQIQPLPVPNGGQSQRFAWSPDGTKVLFSNQGIALWDTTTGELRNLGKNEYHYDWVDNDTIISAKKGATYELWNLWDDSTKEITYSGRADIYRWDDRVGALVFTHFNDGQHKYETLYSRKINPDGTFTDITPLRPVRSIAGTGNVGGIYCVDSGMEQPKSIRDTRYGEKCWRPKDEASIFITRTSGYYSRGDDTRHIYNHLYLYSDNKLKELLKIKSQDGGGRFESIFWNEAQNAYFAVFVDPVGLDKREVSVWKLYYTGPRPEGPPSI